MKKVLGTKAGKKFIHLIAGSTEFLQSITVKPTVSSSGNVRILDMQNYGLILTARYDQLSFDFSQGFNIPYAVKELVYPTMLSDSDLEDMEINPDEMEKLSGEGEEAISEMLAKIYSLDLQDIALNGDTSLAEVASPTTPAEYRQNMLRQMDGYLEKLDNDSRIIKDATHDTIKKEIEALYTAYADDDLITSATRLWMGQADYLKAWKAVTDTTKDLIIKDNKLYYITTPIIPISRMNHLIIGDPAALQVKVQVNPSIETARSIEHRGYKCLLGMKADPIFVKEIFRGLEHTTT
jgi:hypothetical protein